MNNKLYIGNLSYEVSEEDLTTLFGEAGDVSSSRVIRDRDSGRSKGFGFVEMANDEGADSAIAKFDGQDFKGRALRVNIAREKTEGTGPRPRDNDGGFRSRSRY